MQEKFNKVFSYVDGELYWRVTTSNRSIAKSIAGDLDGRGYRRVMLDGVHYKVHRVIWEMHNGVIPKDRVIDHIDRNIKNNRIENLRAVTPAQNSLNIKKHKGVWFDQSRNKWKAQISINNKNVNLGRFKTETEAIDAYEIAKKDREEMVNLIAELG